MPASGGARKEQTPGKKPSRSNITTHHPFQRGIHCNDYYPHNHSRVSSGATSSAEQNQYYLSTLAPAICALFGIGVVVMWQDYRRSGWLLPLALLLTALEQIHIIVSNPSWGTWLIPLIAIPCALAAVILFAARLMPRLRLNARILAPTLCVGLLALMLTSAVWSTIPVLADEASSLPIAGASGQSGVGLGGRGTADTALIRYLEAHRGSAKYLVAVASSNEADAIILETN